MIMLGKNNKGITLVALVITIVILLILAGISISTLTNTGIFEKAKDAKKASENAELEQNKVLDEYEKELDKYMPQELTDDKINKVLNMTENTFLKDANGNIFTLPAGFKVVVNDDTGNAKTVDKGIVIEDATVDSNGNPTATNGSQFVWIPVGKIYTDTKQTEKNSKLIKLGRYNFNEISGEESDYSGIYFEEDTNNESTLKKYGNSIAKNIANFKNSVIENNGYYVGRYEARTETERDIKDDELTQITEKETEQVYNYVTQPQASSLSKNMYNNTKFTSDLMNSYAWDTAIIFLQKCGKNKQYSIKNSVNTVLSQTGTNDDKQCNIYDMASNLLEWTTETAGGQKDCCTVVGGYYDNIYYHTCGRNGTTNLVSDKIFGFRPILYIF